jgi:hypothetical protein
MDIVMILEVLNCVRTPVQKNALAVDMDTLSVCVEVILSHWIAIAGTVTSVKNYLPQNG